MAGFNQKNLTIAGIPLPSVASDAHTCVGAIVVTAQCMFLAVGLLRSTFINIFRNRQTCLIISVRLIFINFSP